MLTLFRSGMQIFASISGCYIKTISNDTNSTLDVN